MPDGPGRFAPRVSPRPAPLPGRSSRRALAVLTLLAAAGCGGGDAGTGGDSGAGGTHPPVGGTDTDAGAGGQLTGGQLTGGQLTGGDATGGRLTDAAPVGGTPADTGPPDLAPAPDAGHPDAAPPGDPDVLVGAFQVLLTAAAAATDVSPAVTAQTSIVGRVQDGPTPELVAWEETLADGPCRLLVPRVPFCSVSCGGSAACVADEVCQPYPESRPVGTVRVTGIETGAGPPDFTMEPVAATYQRSGLPFPPFAEGALVRFEAAGGDAAPFTLEARGIAPLTLTSAPLRLETGLGATLTWPPAAEADRSEVLVRLDISHHGGSNGKVECTAPDSGALSLPASLLDALLALGSAGYPTVVVTRRAVGSVVIAPGRVDLWLLSGVEQGVEIPGLVSCTDDADCPDDQTCAPDLKCQ